MGKVVSLPDTFPIPMKLPALLLLAAAAVSFAADPALTIYNGGYAVVRETLPIDLKSGVNQVSFAGATAQVEADSVILRDIAGKAEFQILEQSYRNDPVSQAMLLSLFEGKTLELSLGDLGPRDDLISKRETGYPVTAFFGFEQVTTLSVLILWWMARRLRTGCAGAPGAIS